MSVDLVLVKKLVAAVLNVTIEGYGDFSGDPNPLFEEQEIIDAVDSAARGVVQAIVDTPGHRRRPDYLELQAVTDGSLVTDTIGGVLIDSKLGTRISPSKLRRYKANVNSLTTIATGGYYSISGHIFSFIGTTAEIETIKDLTSGDVSAPDEYQHAVVEGALSILFTKEGSNVEAAAHHGSLYRLMLEMIRQGASEISAPSDFGQKA